MPSPRSVIKKNLKDEAESSEVVLAALPVYRWTYVVGRDGATSGGCHTDVLPGHLCNICIV